jgi:hydroxymethylpyrimidine/phosphomethylpyrimidine kinase
VLGRVLIVAGSDSGGGAGVQADIKTVTVLGGYAASAITALTVQNTMGVYGIHDVPADFVARQMEAVLDDIGADCVKIGMVHRADIIEAVGRVIVERAGEIPVVVDPVMIAKGGQSLLVAEAIDALKRILIPLATLLTPNLPEAEALAGRKAPSVDAAEALARGLLDLGPDAVLLKGGHRAGAEIVDILVARDRPAERFSGPRIATPHTHGTGCTLASAVAVGLAQGMALSEAVARARDFVVAAIRAAPELGNGHGPLGHAAAMQGNGGDKQ